MLTLKTLLVKLVYVLIFVYSIEITVIICYYFHLGLYLFFTAMVLVIGIIIGKPTSLRLSWWCSGSASDSGLVIERSLVRLLAGALSSQLGQLSFPSLRGI